MARYFFNIHDGQDICDDDGTEFSSLVDIYKHMLLMAQLWIEKEENQREHWRLEVRDEKNNLVASVKFGVEQVTGS